MTTCVKYLDANNNPIPFTPLSTGTGQIAITDVNGIAQFSPDVPASTIYITKVGATVTKVTCPTLEMPATQIPSRDVIGKVGTSCDIWVLHKLTHDVWYYQNRYTGKIGTQHTAKGDAFIDANLDPACFVPAPVAPPDAVTVEAGLRVKADAQETADREEADTGLLAQITGLAGQIGKTATNLAAEALAWRAAIQGIWDKLEAWLVERIVAILIRALDNETVGGKKI